LCLLPVRAIPDYLRGIPHFRLLSPARERSLNRMDRRLYQAARVGAAH